MRSIRKAIASGLRRLAGWIEPLGGGGPTPPTPPH